VDFLGFVLNTKGVSIEKSRVTTIQEWPIPESVRDVQVFLGFANFYRRFIYEYSAIAQPLTQLTKGTKKGKKSGPIDWGPVQQRAFDSLKLAFESAPMLLHFDPKKPIRIETDASGYAIAAILSQPAEWPVNDGRSAVWHPVAFFSKKLNNAELNYGTPDQELMAIVQSFAHWRHYLEGSLFPVEVLTDHSNLRYFMTTTELSRRQARWALQLSAYDFQITHRPGKSNPADAPSRRPDYRPASDQDEYMLPTLRRKLQEAMKRGLLRGPDDVRESTGGEGTDPPVLVFDNHMQKPTSDPRVPGESTELRREFVGPDQPENHTQEEGQKTLAGEGNHEYFLPRIAVVHAMESENAYSSPSDSLLPILLELQRGDVLAAEARENAGKDGNVSWEVDSMGLLRRRRKAYVPPDGAVRGEIMKICHDNQLAGHFGQKKTKVLVQRKYYWPNMAKDIAKYIKGCDICQRVKARRQRKAGEMQALPLPVKPFVSITMDFITDLPPSEDVLTGAIYDSILVIIDRYTKFGRYIPCRKTIDAPELAQLFVSHWVVDKGLPGDIVTDRGPVFTSKFWGRLCYHLNVTRGLSTAFHPQTDGETERQNQTLEMWLRCYVCYLQDDWVNLLPLASFAYNNALHEAIQMSPFEAMYGNSPDIRQGIEDDPTRGEIPAAKENATRIVEVRKELENTWRRTKETQAKWYNQNHRPQAFQPKEFVLLSSKNIKTVRTSQKLDHRFLGPFEIEKKIGKQAYRLILPLKYRRLHPTFHVSLLEPYHRRAGEEPEIYLPDLIDGEEQWEVDRILDRRKRGKKTEWLVRWKGYGPADDEWRERIHLKGCKDLVSKFEKAYSKKPKGEPKRKRRRRV